MENFGIDSSAYAGAPKRPEKAERNTNSAWLTTLMVGLVISAVLAVLSSFVGGMLALILVMLIGSFLAVGIAVVVMFFTALGKG